MGTGEGAGLGVEVEEVRLMDGLGAGKGMVGTCLLGEEVCSEPEESDSVSLLDDGGGGGGRDTGAAAGGGGSVSGFMSSSSRASSRPTTSPTFACLVSSRSCWISSEFGPEPEGSGD